MTISDASNSLPSRSKIFFTGPKSAQAFLLLFTLFFVIQNITFICKDTRPQFTDYQYLSSVKFNDFLKGEIEEGQIRKNHYPPLQYLITQPFFVFLGISENSARLSLAIFWIIFLLSMFGIGNELAGPWSGATVMLLAASSPHVLNYSRIYFLDFPQTAITALAFYFLLKSDDFRYLRSSLLFGLVFALAMNIKWSSIFFLFLPIAWLANPIFLRSKRSLVVALRMLPLIIIYLVGSCLFYWQMLGNSEITGALWLQYYAIFTVAPCVAGHFILSRTEKQWARDDGFETSNERKAINFFRSIGVTALICSIWYFWGAPGIIRKFKVDIGREGFPFDRFLLHFETFLLSIFNFAPIFLVMGCIFFFVQKNIQRRLLILPLGIIGAFIIFSYFKYCTCRYFLSNVIFAAAIGGYWVAGLKRLRPVIFGIILALSLISILAWTVIPGNSGIYTSIRANSISLINLPYVTRFLAPSPPIAMSVELIFKEIKIPDEGFTNIYVFDPVPLRVDVSIPPEAYFNYVNMDGRKAGVMTIDNLVRVTDPPGTYCGITSIIDTLPQSVPYFYFVIIHSIQREPDSEIKILLREFPGKIYSSKIVNVGNGRAATVLKLTSP